MCNCFFLPYGCLLCATVICYCILSVLGRTAVLHTNLEFITAFVAKLIAGTKCQEIVAADQMQEMMTMMLSPDYVGIVDTDDNGETKFDMAPHMLRMKGHVLGIFHSKYGGALTHNLGVCIPDPTAIEQSNSGGIAQTWYEMTDESQCGLASVSVQHKKFSNEAVASCVKSGCKHPESAMGNSMCDEDCNTEACFYDFGDCSSDFEDDGDGFNLRQLVDETPFVGTAVKTVATLASSISQSEMTKTVVAHASGAVESLFHNNKRQLSGAQGLGYECYDTSTNSVRTRKNYIGEKCKFGDEGYCGICPPSGVRTYAHCAAKNLETNGLEHYDVGSAEANLLCGEVPETESCEGEYEWACYSTEMTAVTCTMEYDTDSVSAYGPSCSRASASSVASKTPICISKGGLYFGTGDVMTASSKCDPATKPSVAELVCDDTDIDVKVVSLGFLEQWDGVLPSGERDDSTARMTGTAFGNTIVDSSPEDMPFIHHDCENLIGAKFAHHPKWHLGLKFPLVNEVLNIVYRLNEHIQRDDQLAKAEATFNEEQLLVNFGVWQLPAWFFLIESPFFDRNPGASSSRPANTLLDRFLDVIQYDTMSAPWSSDYSLVRDWSVVGLPSTCNFESVLQRGECSFKFDGMENFFSDTSEINVSLVQCKGAGSKFGLPAFGISLGSATAPEGPTVTNMLETLNM